MKVFIVLGLITLTAVATDALVLCNTLVPLIKQLGLTNILGINPVAGIICLLSDLLCAISTLLNLTVIPEQCRDLVDVPRILASLKSACNCPGDLLMGLILPLVAELLCLVACLLQNFLCIP